MTGVPAERSRMARQGASRLPAERPRSTRTAPGGLTTSQLFRHRSSEIIRCRSIQDGERPKPRDRTQDVVSAQDAKRLVDAAIVELLYVGRLAAGVVEP